MSGLGISIGTVSVHGIREGRTQYRLDLREVAFMTRMFTQESTDEVTVSITLRGGESHIIELPDERSFELVDQALSRILEGNL